MDNIELENEIEIRMNPRDFSLSPSDLIDIMNMFDMDEHDVAFAYSEIVEIKREELKDTAKDVADYFREKGKFYPSFQEFKIMFNEFDPTYVDDNILRDMHKEEIEDENQMSLFEIRKMIKEELGSMWNEFDPDEFEGDAKKAAMQDMGDDFVELGDSRFEKNMNPEDFVDDLDRVRLELPSDEDEFERISKMMTKKKGHEDRFGAGTMNEDESTGRPGLFRPQDSQGNDIKSKALVSNLEGSKKGRVMGFGDDGNGKLVIRVDWAWPIDNNFMDPKEMGEMQEEPTNLIVQGMNENNDDYGRSKLRGVEVTYADGTVIPTSMAAHLTDDEINAYFTPGKMFNIGSVDDNMQAVKSINIIRENMNELNENQEDYRNATENENATDILNAIRNDIGDENVLHTYRMGVKANRQPAVDHREKMGWEGQPSHNDVDSSAMDALGEARGLGHGVKNSGDRNVKLSKDHSHAPVTTLPEGKTLDEKIKNLSEGKVKKGDLLNFISEQAKKFAQDIKEEKKN